MAIVNYQPITLTAGAQRRDCIALSWTLANGDQGQRFEIGAYSDYSLHLVGVPGTGLSMTLRGSDLILPIESTAADWVALTDPRGNPFTFTAIGRLEQVEDMVRWISPEVTEGDGTTSVTAYLFARR